MMDQQINKINKFFRGKSERNVIFSSVFFLSNLTVRCNQSKTLHKHFRIHEDNNDDYDDEEDSGK